MAADWDVVGTAPAQIQNPWAVRNVAPAKSTGDKVAEATLGPAELLGAAIANLPHAAAHGMVDLYRRLTGADTGAPDPALVQKLQVSSGKAGQNLESDVGNMFAITSGEQQGDPREAATFGLHGPARFAADYVAPVASDVASIAPVVSAARAVVGIPGEIATSRAAQAAAQSNAERNLGMVTAENRPIARNLAGTSAQPTVAAHNQGIADQQLAAQVGAKSVKVADLEDAKEAPNAVYSRVEAALPTAPLSPAAQTMVNNVGANDLVVHSPDTQSMIETQKQRLLYGPLTGQQAVDAQRSLRYNGFRNRGLNDPENQALGDAQLKLSDALHQHMVDTLPPNADVTIPQLTQARQALAQINTLQGAAKGENIDLQYLARVYRDNPGLLTGPMADIAEFADLHPEVTSLPSKSERFNPSGVAKDIASIDLKRPISYLQPFAGSAARKALVGTPPAAPTGGLADALAPIDRTPQPPPGMTASTPTAPPLAAAGPPGQIPLADLLSHGVEQSPAAGLSLVPEGIPPTPGGVPFRPNLEHAAGGLSLADEFAPRTYGGQSANSDLAGVMSQGVPEGTVTRAPQNPGLKMPIAHNPAFISNNASVESAASQEAVNRTAAERAAGQARFLIDPDGNVTPIRGVEAADARAPQGSIIVQKGIGAGGKPVIIDRGGLPSAHANGLLSRAFGRKLGDEF